MFTILTLNSVIGNNQTATTFLGLVPPASIYYFLVLYYT
jgi:hypothetical protein